MAGRVANADDGRCSRFRKGADDDEVAFVRIAAMERRTAVDGGKAHAHGSA